MRPRQQELRQRVGHGAWLTQRDLTLEPIPAALTAAPLPRRRRLRCAEVGADHLGIGAHLLGRAGGDHLAEVEHHHPVGEVHHHAHVVLDQRDGEPPLVAEVEDEAGHVLLLLGVHARHRLVEQEQLGVERQRAAELDALLQAVGEGARPGDGGCLRSRGSR